MSAELAYSKEQLAKMTDAEVISAFTSVTGQVTLSCGHCQKKAAPLEKFAIAIRRRCEKKGLFAEMKLPMTCDNQLLRNDSRNKLTNKYYFKIKKANTDEEKAKLKIEMFEALRV